MVDTSTATANFASNLEPPLPPYDPYDPEQNELLKLPLAQKNPFTVLDKALHFLQKVPPVITECQNYIRIRQAMTLAEYITSYHYCCMNPISLTEELSHEPEKRHDFSIQAADVSQYFDTKPTKPQTKRHVPA